MNFDDTEKALSSRSQRIRPAKAAPFLQVSIRTLEDWRAKRIGPKFVKVGRKVFYNMDDLVSFLASCEQPPASPAAPTDVAPL